MVVKRDALILKWGDSVAVAIKQVTKGDTVLAVEENQTMNVLAKDDVPYGHKIALKDIKKGETVIKGGYFIGTAMRDIAMGECVDHTNIVGKRGVYQ